MARIAVFDSGLGSLSIIQAIQKISKSEIIYFADQQNYPYGKKSQAQLRTIMQKSIKLLQEVRCCCDIDKLAGPNGTMS